MDNQESSDGEQTDNLIETTESWLETREKILEEEKVPGKHEISSKPIKVDAKKMDRTIDILRESEYSDISEESMEVSEIMEQSETKKRPRPIKLGEKYEPSQKTEDVIQILDELSKASRSKSEEPEENSTQSESSGDGETPRGVSEIETDSPRDLNDAKNENNEEPAENEVSKKELKKPEIHSIAVSPSEKDIQAMIDKLKGKYALFK